MWGRLGYALPPLFPPSPPLTPPPSLQVAARVDEGVRQLVKAEKHQRAGRLVMCIMLLAALVLLMLLIIVLRAVF